MQGQFGVWLGKVYLYFHLNADDLIDRGRVGVIILVETHRHVMCDFFKEDTDSIFAGTHEGLTIFGQFCGIL